MLYCQPRAAGSQITFVRWPTSTFLSNSAPPLCCPSSFIEPVRRMEQDPEEQAHYESVLLSFREYEAFVMRELFRRKKHLQSMPIEMQRRLPQSSTIRNLHHFVVRVACYCGLSLTWLGAHAVLLCACRMQRTTTKYFWSGSYRPSWSPGRPSSCRRSRPRRPSRAPCAISPSSRARCINSYAIGPKRCVCEAMRAHV